MLNWCSYNWHAGLGLYLSGTEGLAVSTWRPNRSATVGTNTPASCATHADLESRTPGCVLADIFVVFLRTTKYILNVFLIRPTDALISQMYFCQETTCFGQFLCPSSGVFHWYFQARPGWRSFFLDVLESCQQTCMTYTSAECTVENSWWWAEELPETCSVYWQKWIWKNYFICLFY